MYPHTDLFVEEYIGVHDVGTINVFAADISPVWLDLRRRQRQALYLSQPVRTTTCTDYRL